MTPLPYSKRTHAELVAECERLARERNEARHFAQEEREFANQLVAAVRAKGLIVTVHYQMPIPWELDEVPL
jgi:hypothetical protein